MHAGARLVAESRSNKFGVAILMSSLSTAALAAATPGLTKIHESFVVAEHAVMRCEPPDEATQKKFRANYDIVRTFARKELRARFPESTDAMTEEALKKQAELLTRRVDEVIQTEGCASEKVRTLVQSYRQHANWGATGAASEK